MQAQTSVVNFYKCTSNKKTLVDQYRRTFDKGTKSIKVTRRSKLTCFTVIKRQPPGCGFTPCMDKKWKSPISISNLKIHNGFQVSQNPL